MRFNKCHGTFINFKRNSVKIEEVHDNEYKEGIRIVLYRVLKLFVAV